jgi:cell wall-associated NlpC family hydrolase
MSNSHSPQADIHPEMERPEFWLDRFTGSGKIILDAPAINAFNCRILQSLSGTVCDLTSYPRSLRKPALKTLIAASRFPEGPVYGDGRLLTPDDFSHLTSRLNLKAVPEDNAVGYGFTLRRANLRAFPTTLRCTVEPDDMEFDLFQETALNPAEPLLILFQSAAGNWYYIQTVNFHGWVAAQDIVRADSRGSWLSYWQNRDFLVVSANHIKVSRPDATGNNEELHFEMGAQLPLAGPETFPDFGDDFRINIPVREATGHLCSQTVRLPRTAAVNRGYLPYTGANIITQAFKMLGIRYGWGGAHESVDCSSFIMNIYRSFGFQFPRNAREQERLPGKAVSFKDQAESERAARLSRLLPGAILNLPGHVMLYLGEYNGSHFIMHALSSYGTSGSRGEYVKTYFLKVCVTGLDLARSNGQTLLAALTSGRNIF